MYSHGCVTVLGQQCVTVSIAGYHQVQNATGEGDNSGAAAALAAAGAPVSQARAVAAFELGMNAAAAPFNTSSAASRGGDASAFPRCYKRSSFVNFPGTKSHNTCASRPARRECELQPFSCTSICNSIEAAALFPSVAMGQCVLRWTLCCLTPAPYGAGVPLVCQRCG